MTTAWDDAEVGAGTSVWTVEGDKEKALGEDGEDLSDNEDGDDSTKVNIKTSAPVSKLFISYLLYCIYVKG